MKATVNNTEVELPEGQTVEQLIEQNVGATAGVAVAINGKIVRRPDWSTHTVKDGDNVLLVQAAYGG